MSAKPIIDGAFQVIQKLVDLGRKNRNPCDAFEAAKVEEELAGQRYDAEGTRKAWRAWMGAKKKRNSLEVKCARAKARARREGK